MKKRLLSVLLAITIVFTMGLAACGNTDVSSKEGIMDADPAQNAQVVQTTCQYLYDTVTDPVFGSVGGEWTMFGLSRAGYEMTPEYVDGYIQSVEETLTSTDGVLSERKYTEYSRLVIALTALGYDVTDVAGYDLLTYLGDFERVSAQGFNGSAWALIAMDTVGYEFSENLGCEVVSTRELLIQDVLDNVVATGGWGFQSDEADVDMTAMAITALWPYTEDEQVANAIEKGIQYLSEALSEDGGYEAYELSTVETCAQVVLALSTVGIDADTDERFVKNGTSLYDALLAFQMEDGSFCHVKGEGTDYLATEQACYTLIAYDRFINGQADLFDLSDL